MKSEIGVSFTHVSIFVSEGRKKIPIKNPEKTKKRRKKEEREREKEKKRCNSQKIPQKYRNYTP